MALSKEVKLESDQVPLNDFFELLEKAGGLSIRPDWSALMRVGVKKELAVHADKFMGVNVESLSRIKFPLKKILEDLLLDLPSTAPLGMAMDKRTLIITTREDLKTLLKNSPTVTPLYPRVETQQTWERLKRERLPKIEMFQEDTALQMAVWFVRDTPKPKLDIFVNWPELSAVNVREENSVNFDGENMTCEDALNGILSAVSPRLGFDVIDGVVVISRRGSLPRYRKLAQALARSPDANQQADARLCKVVPYWDFTDGKMGAVLEFLAEANDMQFKVDWESLKLSGVSQETPAPVEMSRVSSKTVLELAFARINGSVPIGLALDKGTLVISTQKEIDALLRSSRTASALTSDLQARKVEKEALEKLRLKMPKTDLENTELSSVLTFMSETSGLGVYADWDQLDALKVGKTSMVSFHGENQSIEALFDAILNSVDKRMGFEVVSGAVLVSRRDCLPKNRAAVQAQYVKSLQMPVPMLMELDSRSTAGAVKLLAKAADIAVVLAPGVDPEARIKFDTRGMSVEQIVAAIAKAAGAEYRIEFRRIVIVPRTGAASKPAESKPAGN